MEAWERSLNLIYYAFTNDPAIAFCKTVSTSH